MDRVKLFIDINTGEVRRTLAGEPINALRFFHNDILPLEITLTDAGVAVTSQYLTAGRAMEIALHGFSFGQGPIVSATTSSLTGEVATLTLDLTATELADHFADKVAANAVETQLHFEVQVTEPGTYRQTFHQSRASVARDLNASVNITDASFSNDFSTDFSTL